MWVYTYSNTTIVDLTVMECIEVEQYKDQYCIRAYSYNGDPYLLSVWESQDDAQEELGEILYKLNEVMG